VSLKREGGNWLWLWRRNLWKQRRSSKHDVARVKRRGVRRQEKGKNEGWRIWNEK